MDPRPAPGPLRKLLAVAVGGVLLAAGLAFSVIVFAVGASVGLGLWLWFRWRTRGLRRALREARARAEAGVIEGEAEVVREEDASPDRRRLPPGR